MAEVITVKLCLSAAAGMKAEDAFTRIEKTLGDARRVRTRFVRIQRLERTGAQNRCVASEDAVLDLQH